MPIDTRTLERLRNTLASAGEPSQKPKANRTPSRAVMGSWSCENVYASTVGRLAAGSEALPVPPSVLGRR